MFFNNNIFRLFPCVLSGGDDRWRLLRGVGPAQVQFNTRAANRMDGVEDDRNMQNASHTRRATDQSKHLHIYRYKYLFFHVFR